jgi:hypothetical protein
MIRRALLIGAPGPANTSRFLPGVAKDFRNYQRFLRSPSGGAWTDDEIVRAYNPTRTALLAQVRHLRADYTLIVFTGHGGTDPSSNRPFLEINFLGEHVWLDELVTLARQQLVVLMPHVRRGLGWVSYRRTSAVPVGAASRAGPAAL